MSAGRCCHCGGDCHPRTLGVFDAHFQQTGHAASSLRFPFAYTYTNLTASTVLDEDFGVTTNETLDVLELGMDHKSITTNIPPSDTLYDTHVWLPTAGSAEELACIDYLAAGGTIALGLNNVFVQTTFDAGAGTTTHSAKATAAVASYNSFLVAMGSATRLRMWDEDDLWKYDLVYPDGTGWSVRNPAWTTDDVPFPVKTRTRNKRADDLSQSAPPWSMPPVYSQSVYTLSEFANWKQSAFFSHPDPATHWEYNHCQQGRWQNANQYPSPADGSQFGQYWEFDETSSGSAPRIFDGDVKLIPESLVERVGGGTIVAYRQTGTSFTGNPENQPDMVLRSIIDLMNPPGCRELTEAKGARNSNNNGFTAFTYSGKTYNGWGGSDLWRTRISTLRSHNPDPVIATHSDVSIERFEVMSSTNMQLELETPDDWTGSFLLAFAYRAPLTPAQPLWTDSHFVSETHNEYDVQYDDGVDQVLIDMVADGWLPPTLVGRRSLANGRLFAMFQEQKTVTQFGDSDVFPAVHKMMIQGLRPTLYLRNIVGGVPSTIVSQSLQKYLPCIFQDRKVYADLSATSTFLSWSAPAHPTHGAKAGFAWTKTPLSDFSDITNWPTIVDGVPDLTTTGSLFSLGFALLLDLDAGVHADEGTVYTISAGLPWVDFTVKWPDRSGLFTSMKSGKQVL